MTTSRAVWPLRTPGPGRAGYLELFFDLVFVFALFRLSQELLEDLSWGGALRTLVLLLAVLVVWFFVALFTDAFDVEDPLIQVLGMSIMFGTLVMAAAAPAAFGPKGLVFASAYSTIRVGATGAAVFLLRGHEAQRNAERLLFWFSLTSVPWVVGAFQDGWARAALWIAAVAADYVGAALGFPAPRLGRSGARRIDIVVSEQHWAERYQQFFIVALGEPILATGLAFANSDFGAARSAATVVAFATTALLWRIYIHRAGALLAEAIALIHAPRRAAVLTIYSHAIMVAGVVAIAVGGELVIQHPFGHPDVAWIFVILGGPALFLVGRAIFEYVVFGRVSRSRLIGVLVLVAIVPAMRLVPPLAVATAAALVLGGVAVADAARSRRLPAERPSPPG
jgi:low temperature requirement protein LtrA